MFTPGVASQHTPDLDSYRHAVVKPNHPWEHKHIWRASYMTWWRNQWKSMPCRCLCVLVGANDTTPYWSNWGEVNIPLEAQKKIHFSRRLTYPILTNFPQSKHKKYILTYKSLISYKSLSHYKSLNHIWKDRHTLEQNLASFLTRYFYAEVSKLDQTLVRWSWRYL